MSATLQVALFSAGLAFIGLVACIIPILLQARRHLDHLVRSSDHLQVKIEVLLQDSHQMVANMNDLSLWAGDQMDDMGRVVHTIQDWTERGNRLVNEMGTVIDPPILSIVRDLNMVRKGAAGFLKAMTHSNGNNPTKKEKENV